MDQQKLIGRRSFLKRSGGGALLATGTARAQTRPAPSDRVVVGLIGLGVRGRDHHLRKLLTNPRAEVAAICDVDRNHADLAAQIFLSRKASKPLVYYDFRPLLERSDLDAVVISTPDHWHSTIAIQAIEAGKDVYRTTNDAFLFGSRRFRLERRPRSGPLAGHAGVRAGVEPDGGTNAAMAG